MKLSLRTLAWPASALLLLLIMLFAWALIDRWRFNNGSRELSVQLVETAFSQGDMTLWREVISDSLRETWRGDSLADYLTDARNRAGALGRIENISGSAQVPLLPWQRNLATAQYELVLILGDVDAQLSLNWERDQGWRLSAFRLLADALQN